jgi:hypothetical protein
MEKQVKIIGFVLILLAFVHSIFPKYFNWVNELRKVSLINKQMMYVHTFFIALILFLMGILCLTSSVDLIETKLGQRVSLGLGIFWIARLFVQFFGYSSNLWKGKKPETTVHVVFLLLWMYLATLFCLIYYKGY